MAALGASTLGRKGTFASQPDTEILGASTTGNLAINRLECKAFLSLQPSMKSPEGIRMLFVGCLMPADCLWKVSYITQQIKVTEVT